MRVIIRSLVVLVLLSLVFSLAPTQTEAAGGDPRIGTKLSVAGHLDERIVFPAGEPFHISHGWGCGDVTDPDPRCMGPNTNFTLFMVKPNGKARVVKLNYYESEEPKGNIVRHWYANWPDGASGQITFIGVWQTPGEKTPFTQSVRVRFTKP